MSSFAKRQLEKMGWKEGQGLGKNGTGVSSYIQVVRRDPGLQAGLGHEGGKSGTDNSDMGLDSILSTIQRRKGRNATPSPVASDDEAPRGHSSAKRGREADKHSAVRNTPRTLEKPADKNCSSSSSSSDDDDDSADCNKGTVGDVLTWDDKTLLEKCGGVRLGRAGRHRFFGGKLARIEASHAASSAEVPPEAQASKKSRGGRSSGS